MDKRETDRRKLVEVILQILAGAGALAAVAQVIIMILDLPRPQPDNPITRVVTTCAYEPVVERHFAIRTLECPKKCALQITLSKCIGATKEDNFEVHYSGRTTEIWRRPFWIFRSKVDKAISYAENFRGFEAARDDSRPKLREIRALRGGVGNAFTCVFIDADSDDKSASLGVEASCECPEGLDVGKYERGKCADDVPRVPVNSLPKSVKDTY